MKISRFKKVTSQKRQIMINFSVVEATNEATNIALSSLLESQFNGVLLLKKKKEVTIFRPDGFHKYPVKA
jgi:hypothetical protein